MLKEISPRELTVNPFDAFDRRWALLTAGKPDSFNTMTVSWGQVGVLWNQDIATAYVRPQRYTKGFLDSNETYTLSFFGEAQRELLKLCGAKSGRELDKMHLSGLTPVFREGSVWFEEAELVLVCRKIYIGKIDPDGFVDETLIAKNYPKNDFHSFYIGAIEKVLSR